MARRTRLLAEKRAVALATALLLGGAAHAQSSNNPFGFLSNIFTGSISKESRSAAASPEPMPQAAAGSSQGWSGQDGASGDPLMTAAAFALSWWVTVRVIEEHPMTSEIDSEHGEPDFREKAGSQPEAEDQGTRA